MSKTTTCHLCGKAKECIDTRTTSFWEQGKLKTADFDIYVCRNPKCSRFGDETWVECKDEEQTDNTAPDGAEGDER